MKIGIDISQLAYPETGVANYLQNLVQNLIEIDKKNEYILFFSSLRGKLKTENLKLKSSLNVQIKTFRIPPTILDILWNKLHILPIESLIGDVDIFITSDWTEPPAKKAKKVTILYDLIVYKYPGESHHQTSFNPLKLIISPNIVDVQKRKLKWVKKESQRIFCISEATKKNAEEILGIPQNKLAVIYPGF
ncbi:MAG: glycosyltransferase [Candidatus Levyibacteriota bacterium]